MIVGHIGGSSSGGYETQKSLRFRASASAYLSRTYTSAGSTTTWTQSVWVKRGALSYGFQDIFRTYYTATYHIGLYFNANDALNFVQQTGSEAINMLTTQVFRDPSAWYHIVLAVDSTQATESNRVKLYVNGVQITSFNTTKYPSQNSDTYMCSSTGWTHVIGKFYNFAATHYFDGYLSEINFIDGQALDPSYFGQVSAETGAWIPKNYTGTYGTNGFYLPFNDGSTLDTLTADHSGNGNNWKANNISLTAGATYDWMDDTPTNNFAVLNAVHAGRSTLTNGNLTASGADDLPTIIPDSGTWYFERGGSAQIWTPPTAFPSGTGDYNFGQMPWQSTGPTGGQKALCTGNFPTPSILNPKEHFDVVLATGANIKSTAEAVFPGNFLEWIKDRGNANNHQLIDTVRGTSAVLQSNTTGAETTYSAPSGSSVGWAWKAGGAPVTNNAGSIQSQVSANPQAGFSIVTYTGKGANATVGHGLGKQPTLVIVKRSSSGSNWAVFSMPLRILFGVNQILYLNTTDAMVSDATVFGAEPISSILNIKTSSVINSLGSTYVAYCFTDIPGYSKIGSYIGNGSADGPFVYCGFRPRYVLIKRVNAAGNWYTLDSARLGYNPSNYTLFPNLSNAEQYSVIVDITSSGFKVRNTAADVNASGGSYIFYAIAEQPFQFANAR